MCGRFSCECHKKLLEMIIPSLDRSGLKHRLAIVGSAPIVEDQSNQIDGCDFVIRFNECKVYGGNSGVKVNVLCVTNTGIPSMRISVKQSILRSGFYDLVSEIWFPRNPTVHTAYSGADFSDNSEHLIERNQLSHLKSVYFSKELNKYVFDLLEGSFHGECNCPSTGIFGIMYVLTERRFMDYDKFLFGFGFSGYICHPWKSEEHLISHYADTRDDLHIVSPC